MDCDPLEATFELPILDAPEVKEETHEYNSHICHNRHKVCLY